jgi:hypothetical protein
MIFENRPMCLFQYMGFRLKIDDVYWYFKDSAQVKFGPIYWVASKAILPCYLLLPANTILGAIFYGFMDVII